MSQFPVNRNELEVIFESVHSVGLEGILWLMSVTVVDLDSNQNKFSFIPIPLVIFYITRHQCNIDIWQHTMRRVQNSGDL